MFPLFTNGALLAGLAGIAAPILIHLLLRRKSQRMRFSSNQFFVKKDEQSMRKRKLRNLLLLSARTLLFLLIVLAFARPYLPGTGAAAGAKRRQVILLIDASASMQANGLGGQQWKRAKELARQTLAGLQADDRAALIACSTRGGTVSEFAPPPVVARKLEDLLPTFGAGDLAEGLQQALKKLAFVNPAWTTTLCVVSDFQRNGCLNLASAPLPGEIEVKLLDLGERFTPNAAVTDLRLETQNQSGPHAVVTSFSDENYSALRTAFKIDGKEVVSREMALPAGAVTNVPISLPPLSPGWHSVEFRIEAKDGLAADDARHGTVYVPEPARGLVVETRKVPRAFQEESFFVGAALDPSTGDGQSAPSRFAFEKIDLSALAQKLSPQPGQAKVEYVVLPGVKQLPTATVAALTAYVKAGGGLLLFLGENASANRYNADLRELLPASLGKPEATSETEAPWRLAEIDKSSPLFAPFREANSGNLFLPGFTQRYSLAALPEGVVVAEFDDGTPFAVRRQVGQGRVVLVNTSADTAWTDWQKHKTFVPWLHASALFLAGRDAAHERETLPALASGTDADFDLGTKLQTLTLRRPDGTATNYVTDELGRLRDIPIEAPGVYSWRDAAGRETRRFAANLPAAESELSNMTPADFQQQLVRRTDPANPSLMAGFFGDSGRGHELWRALLLAALVLMLAEPFVANKTLA